MDDLERDIVLAHDREIAAGDIAESNAGIHFCQAAEQLDSELQALPDMPEAARAKIEDRIERYRVRIDRYESDPAARQGKKELLAKAKEWEARRDQAAERDPNFDFAAALFQIAIVLGSVSIIAPSRSLVKLSGVLAVAGSLVMLNGYFLLVHLPFE